MLQNQHKKNPENLALHGNDDDANVNRCLWQAMAKVIKSYAVQPLEEMILAARVITSEKNKRLQKLCKNVETLPVVKQNRTVALFIRFVWKPKSQE